MHSYSEQVSGNLYRSRIRELEEQLASAELALDIAWDEIEEGRGRECRWRLTAIGFGVVAALAIGQLAMGR